MPAVQVLNRDGGQIGMVELPAALFDVEISEVAVHSAVVAYEVNQRQGNSCVKGRGEVRRSGRKHHKQKGTGQARRGTVTTNLLRGGGVAFGLPKPRSYRRDLPRAIKRLALRSALTSKRREGRVTVVDQFELGQPSTKAFAALLAACGLTGRKVLFVTAENAPVLVRSGRNIPGVRIRAAGTVGTYDIVAAEDLLLSQPAVEALARLHSDPADAK